MPGGKRLSGVLPRPRQILKFPPLHQKRVDQGYAEGILHPPGSAREPIIKPFPHLKSLVHKSSPNPHRYGVKNYKDEVSKLRREYYRQALAAAYDRYLTNLKKQAAAAEVEKKRIEAQKKGLEQRLEDTIFTLPTVESFLLTYHPPTTDPRVRKTEKLRRQRAQMHRLSQEINHRALQLIDLYQSAETFIVSIEELNKRIDEEFADNKEFPLVDYSHRTLASLVNDRTRPGYGIDEREGIYSTVVRNLVGTSYRGRPGFAEIEHALSTKFELEADETDAE
ncbi:hypothetical protein V1525DRAFT_398193 [Lipomyces kononenkoae]|uniref:Uncharacterized protein n=1 Tax=Lipomyces kononenkoae TaxID=34357 RepID=A0ACC3T7R3_LIPKO